MIILIVIAIVVLLRESKLLDDSMVRLLYVDDEEPSLGTEPGISKETVLVKEDSKSKPYKKPEEHIDMNLVNTDSADEAERLLNEIYNGGNNSK